MLLGVLLVLWVEQDLSIRELVHRLELQLETPQRRLRRVFILSFPFYDGVGNPPVDWGWVVSCLFLVVDL